MVFTQETLQYQRLDPLSILNQATYLTEQESVSRLVTIPLKEISSLDCNLVSLSDLQFVCESYGLDYSRAVQALAEANGIPSCLIAAEVPEEALIESPELADDIPQVVVAPLSKNDPCSIMIEHVVQCSLNEEDESIIESAIDTFLLEGKLGRVGDLIGKAGIGIAIGGLAKQGKVAWDAHKAGGKYGMELGFFKVPDAVNRMGQANDILNVGGALAGVGTAMEVVDHLGDAVQRAYQEYKDKPKSTIAKVIAKLRSLYAKVQEKANQKVESGKAKVYHRVAAKILNVIDKLLRAMQRAAN